MLTESGERIQRCAWLSRDHWQSGQQRKMGQSKLSMCAVIPAQGHQMNNSCQHHLGAARRNFTNFSIRL